MLGERLERLKELADAKAAADYLRSSAENFGFANGLRCAVAYMTGVEYQPFLSPETFPPPDDRLRAQLVKTAAALTAAEAQLDRTSHLIDQLEHANRLIRSQSDVIDSMIQDHGKGIT